MLCERVRTVLCVDDNGREDAHSFLLWLQTLRILAGTGIGKAPPIWVSKDSKVQRAEIMHRAERKGREGDTRLRHTIEGGSEKLKSTRRKI